MYVFDTDVLSGILKGRLPEETRVRIAALDRGKRHTTSITVGELYYGALRSAATTRWLSAIEDLLPEFTCLDFDAAAARGYAEVRSFLERSGRRLDDPDLRIASICAARDQILISGNERHFGRIPRLRYENWMKP
ncbi:MAG TPA: type II toxin-antitoxin system VapC family toxin [Polyangia bacterium]|jgi:tRNA(fMet)-specific endonuclease VapC|nr:type II toxin-antitoxin system VapC family toxin [Polyangia bacterium]